jgi:hypothetical protein
MAKSCFVRELKVLAGEVRSFGQICDLKADNSTVDILNTESSQRHERVCLTACTSYFFQDSVTARIGDIKAKQLQFLSMN